MVAFTSNELDEDIDEDVAGSSVVKIDGGSVAEEYGRIGLNVDWMGVEDDVASGVEELEIGITTREALGEEVASDAEELVYDV